MVKYPNSIVSGETFFAQCETGEYASASIAIRGPSAINADADGSTGYFVFRLDSAEWLGGSYQFEIWGTRTDASRGLIGRFPLTVEASIVGSGAGLDLRTQTEKIVDALEAKIGGIGLSDEDQSVLKYRLNNRELENYPLSEMRGLLSFFRKRLIRERRKARGLTGPGPSIRFHI